MVRNGLFLELWLKFNLQHTALTDGRQPNIVATLVKKGLILPLNGTLKFKKYHKNLKNVVASIVKNFSGNFQHLIKQTSRDSFHFILINECRRGFQ